MKRPREYPCKLTAMNEVYVTREILDDPLSMAAVSELVGAAAKDAIQARLEMESTTARRSGETA